MEPTYAGPLQPPSIPLIEFLDQHTAANPHARWAPGQSGRSSLFIIASVTAPSGLARRRVSTSPNDFRCNTFLSLLPLCRLITLETWVLLDSRIIL